MSRFLIFTPRAKDCQLVAETIAVAGLEAHPSADADELIAALGDCENITGLITTEEMLRPAFVERLRNAIERQPFWSELPVIVFTTADTNGNRTRYLEKLGPRANVTTLDRPVSLKTLASIAMAMHRARLRQYEVRDLFGKLEDRIRERDRFLAILGHELRNPLGAIVLAAQMTDSDGKLDAQHAERIERQAHHLSRLVDDLLDHSRVTTGKITLKRSRVDLNQLVEQCLRAIPRDRHRRDVELTFVRCPEPLPLLVDGIRIDQVISNLLTNAFKYTPEGGRITVCTSLENGMVGLSVKDTGVGIAPDRIGSVFDLFSQAENAIGRSEGGMGIGLSLVRSLVELHGGTVNASSDGLNQGSTFIVTLPLATDAEAAGATLPARPAAATEQAIPAARRIVIVDDNADIRDLLEIGLRRLGHDVSTAADGQTGLQKIVAERPDLAIVDIGMSGIDGYELARRVRRELNDQVVLVALTGFGQAEDREHAFNAGFDVHFVKPVRIAEIERILTFRGNAPASAET